MPRTWTEWFMVLLFICAIIFAAAAHGRASMIYTAICFIVTLIGLAYISFKEVPASPKPSVAMPTFLGARYDRLIKEGWVCVCPGIEDLIVEDYEPEELFFTFDDVACALAHTDDGKPMPGGLVNVEISVMYVPDHEDPVRFKMFLNKGRRPKIKSQLESKLGELVRHQGKGMTWEEFTFAKSSLSVELISSLTNLEPPDKEDDAAVKTFLETALVSGVEDSTDFGIKFHRLNVTEVEASANLQKASQEAAAELEQRKAEQTDMDTMIILAMKVIAAWGISAEVFAKKTPAKQRALMKEAMEVVRIERGRATETIIRGSRDSLTDAAAILKAPPASGKTPKSDPGT